MLGQDLLQTHFESRDTHLVLLQLCPRLSLLEERRFQSMTISSLVMKSCLSRITHDVPAELQGLTLTLKQVEDCILGTTIDQVWLGQDAHGTQFLVIHLICHLQDLLSRDVHICWDNCQQ